MLVSEASGTDTASKKWPHHNWSEPPSEANDRATMLALVERGTDGLRDKMEVQRRMGDEVVWI
jgi:hypothetical protein